jgi:hypothetical protein
MQQIADWLKKLGMSEYAERFAEERIEIDVLPELTDQDLERLRIPLGHRRRMLRAIRGLSGPATATPQATPTASPPAQDHAERRQLTVMFWRGAADCRGSICGAGRPCKLARIADGAARPTGLARNVKCQISANQVVANMLGDNGVAATSAITRPRAMAHAPRSRNQACSSASLF